MLPTLADKIDTITVPAMGLAGIAVAAGMFAAVSQAHAFDVAESCRETGVMLTTLSSQFSEQMVFAGVEDESGNIISLHVAPSGSWTLVTSNHGMSCLAVFGVSGKINN